MWKFEKLSQSDQNKIIDLWNDGKLLQVVEILNKNKVAFAPIATCCGRDAIKTRISNAIESGYIKKA